MKASSRNTAPGAVLPCCRPSRRTGRWGCPLWGGAGLPGLIVLLGICSIIFTIAMPHVRGAREASAGVKLQEDVRVLNAAVQTFELSGGSLAGVTSVDEVLRLLKSRIPREAARRHIGLKGSMADQRLIAKMQSQGEAALPGQRALWNAEERQFVLSTRGGPGVKEFVMQQGGGAGAEVERIRFLDGSDTSGWVWRFTDEQPRTPIKNDIPVMPAAYVPPEAPADEVIPSGGRYHVSEANAWGYFISADLRVAGLPLSTGQVGLLNRTASEPFSLTHGFTQSVGLNTLALVTVLDVDGTFFSSVHSDVGAGSDARYATGVGEATSFVLKLVQLPRVLLIQPAPVLELRAATLRTTSTISGEYGSLEPSGMGTVTNLQVRILGAGLIDLAVTGEENQTIDLNALGLAGVRLIVNKVQHSSEAADQRTTERAALHVEVTALDVAGLGLVRGDIYAGRSGATLKAEHFVE